MSCDIWTLCYWHRLRKMSADRMLQNIFMAWMDSHNPWQQNINKLIAEYKLDAAASLAYNKTKFAKYVRALAVDSLQTQWSTTHTRQGGGLCTRYHQACGAGAVTQGMMGMHPVARRYITYLSSSGRGWAAELCMKLRMESLPLRCLHGKPRKHETLAAQAARERCPMCNAQAETPAHFLLHCPAYTASRENMMLHLIITSPQLVADMQADATQWRRLLADNVIGISPPAAAAVAAAAAVEGGQDVVTTSAAAETAKAVVDYVVSSWKQRSSALTGREANAREGMA